MRNGRGSRAHRLCEPTGRANARPMTGSAKQSLVQRTGALLCRHSGATRSVEPGIQKLSEEIPRCAIAHLRFALTRASCRPEQASESERDPRPPRERNALIATLRLPIGHTREIRFTTTNIGGYGFLLSQERQGEVFA